MSPTWLCLPLTSPPPPPRPSTHLYLLYHLLAEGAHLGGDADGHAVGGTVLRADPVEGTRAFLDCAVEVSLGEGTECCRGLAATCFPHLPRGLEVPPRGPLVGANGQGAGQAAHLGLEEEASPRT